MQSFGQWVRGVASDIRSAFSSGGNAPGVTAASRAPVPAVSSTVPEAPANGTELLRARAAGGSEIWISNRGAHDIVARLVDASTSTPMRAIYVYAKSKACIRNISPGTYQVTAEVGEGWDGHGFESKRRIAEKSGQFQCMNLITGQVTSGMCFEAVGEDGRTRSKNNIVLGAF